MDNQTNHKGEEPIDTLLNHNSIDKSHTNHNLNTYAPNDTRKRKDKSSNKARWLRILYDYSQATTFHGICYVTAQQPFWIRRYLFIYSSGVCSIKCVLYVCF